MKGFNRNLLAILLLGLVSCGEDEPQREKVYLLRAVETTHEYIPNVKTKVWSYNGQVPGPTLHANVGEIVTVRFVNNLPEPVTVHWHGLELPANMDGSHISQKPVPPGGEFIYKFKALRAATYWYHSHVKPFEHVEKGLQGAFIVHDPEENKRLKLPAGNKVFMLDDVLLDGNAQVAPALPEDPYKRAETLTNGRIGNHIIVNGERQPQINVVSGKPIRLRFVNSSNSRFFRLSWPGQILHRIGGDVGLLPEPQEIFPIDTIEDPGSKGQYISNPDLSLGLLLTPGERAEVLWTPQGEHGVIIPLELHDLERGQHVAQRSTQGIIELHPDGQDGKRPKRFIANFRINGSHMKDLPVVPQSLRPTRTLTRHDITNKDPLMIMFGHSMPDNKGNVMFFATADHKPDGSMKPYPYMKLVEMLNDDKEETDGNKHALNGEVGEVRVIEVVNMSRGIHPFHIHGFPFQLLETEWIDEEHPERNKLVKNDKKSWKEWKDTIPVPGRPGFRMKSRTIMRLLVDFSDEGRAGEVVAHGGHSMGERSGGWMAHCHILEHAGKGMATWLNLWEKGKNPYKGKGHHHDHGHHHGGGHGHH